MRWDPLWFRPAYVHTGQLVNMCSDRELREKHPDRVPDHGEVTKRALHLAWAIEKTLLELESMPKVWSLRRRRLASQRRQDDVLRDLLSRLERYALLAAATIMARASQDIAPDMSPGGPLPRPELVRKLEPASPTITHRELANSVRPWQRLHRLEAVNLASYLSELGSRNHAAGNAEHATWFWGQAFAQVELALTLNPELVLEDPTLHGLLKDSGKVEDIADAARTAAMAKASDKRTEIKDHLGVVGPGSSRMLLLHGVKDKRDLVSRAATEWGRNALAAVTGIPDATLLDWAYLADLCDRLEEGRGPVHAGYARLLQEAGVGTIKSFVGKRDLADHLSKLNARLSAVPKNPTLDAVRAWQRALKDVKPRVTA